MKTHTEKVGTEVYRNAEGSLVCDVGDDKTHIEEIKKWIVEEAGFTYEEGLPLLEYSGRLGYIDSLLEKALTETHTQAVKDTEERWISDVLNELKDCSCQGCRRIETALLKTLTKEDNK